MVQLVCTTTTTTSSSSDLAPSPAPLTPHTPLTPITDTLHRTSPLNPVVDTVLSPLHTITREFTLLGANEAYLNTKIRDHHPLTSFVKHWQVQQQERHRAAQPNARRTLLYRSHCRLTQFFSNTASTATTCALYFISASIMQKKGPHDIATPRIS